MCASHHTYRSAIEKGRLSLGGEVADLYVIIIIIIIIMYRIDRITIGTIIFINDGSKLYGILQATNSPRHYVKNAAITSVEVAVRPWHAFNSLSLETLPVVWGAEEQRWIGRNLAVAIVGMMLKDKGSIRYPVSEIYIVIKG